MHLLTDWWKDHLGENYESDHESWLDTIGNLTLTGYNSEMSNYDSNKQRYPNR
jgi:uncharacterized protein DUF1524